MKFYLHGNPTNIKEYTLRLINYLFTKNKLEMVSNPDDSDLVLVSLCDSTEVKDILTARKFAKPVITGGMISEVPIVNELSDYVYHGEIWGLIDHLRANKPLEDCEYITTKDKKALKISQEIRWKEVPIIRVGSRAAYYYCGKGCPMKCKYCLIGNARKYQHIPERLYRNAERNIKKVKAKMMPIAAFNPHAAKTERIITEVLLKEYVKNNGLGLKNSLIRSGIEFATPEISKGLAKGVTIDDLNAALEISKFNNSRMILYFIAGLEDQEEVELFFNKIILDYDIKPVITIVFTYFAPQPMTPMFDFDLRERKQIDAKQVFRIVNARNKRIRVMPLAGIKKSTMRALTERCANKEEYVFISQFNKKSITYDQILQFTETKYPHLLGSSNLDTCLSRKRGIGSTIGSYWV